MAYSEDRVWYVACPLDTNGSRFADDIFNRIFLNEKYDFFY